MISIMPFEIEQSYVNMVTNASVTMIFLLILYT